MAPPPTPPPPSNGWLFLKAGVLGVVSPLFDKMIFLDVVCDRFVNVLFSYHSIKLLPLFVSFIPVCLFPPQPTHHHHRQPIIKENESKR